MNDFKRIFTVISGLLGVAPALANDTTPAPIDFTPQEILDSGADNFITVGAWPVFLGCHHMHIEFGDKAKRTYYKVEGASLDQGDNTSPKAIWDPDDTLVVLTLNSINRSQKFFNYFKKEAVFKADIIAGTEKEIETAYADVLLYSIYRNLQKENYHLLTHNSNTVVRSMLDLLEVEIPIEMRRNLCVPGESTFPEWWDKKRIRDAAFQAVIGTTDPSVRQLERFNRKMSGFVFAAALNGPLEQIIDSPDEAQETRERFEDLKVIFDKLETFLKSEMASPMPAQREFVPSFGADRR